jgi:hypothetical protein
VQGETGKRMKDATHTDFVDAEVLMKNVLNASAAPTPNAKRVPHKTPMLDNRARITGVTHVSRRF